MEEKENARGRSSRVVSAKVQMVTIYWRRRASVLPVLARRSRPARIFACILLLDLPLGVRVSVPLCCVPACCVRACACCAPVSPRPRDHDSDSPDRRDVAFDSLLRFHLCRGRRDVVARHSRGLPRVAPFENNR